MPTFFYSPIPQLLRSSNCRTAWIMSSFRPSERSVRVIVSRRVAGRESEGADEALRHYYDRVLIYGSKEMFSTCCTYHLPVPPGGLHYCGYLVSQVPVKPAHEVRQSIGLPFERFVFVSAGGGSDGQLL